MAAMRMAYQKLRDLREEQLKTQQQVATDAGVSLFTYQKAERGRPMSRLTIRRIAEALDVEAWEDLLAPKELTRA